MGRPKKPNPLADIEAWGPVIPRAAIDRRLTGLHLRLLIKVCSHDRFSRALGEGQGCWASPVKMADELGAHRSSVSTAMNELVDFGYLFREPRKNDRRQSVYRARYLDVHGAEIVDRSAQGNVSPAEVLPDANASPEVCRLQGQSGYRSTNGNSPEIRTQYPSQYIELSSINSVETGIEEINSPEGAALHAVIGDDVGANLSRFERIWKRDPSSLNLDAWREWLEQTSEDPLDGEPTSAGWAHRLLDQVDTYLERLPPASAHMARAL